MGTVMGLDLAAETGFMHLETWGEGVGTLRSHV